MTDGAVGCDDGHKGDALDAIGRVEDLFVAEGDVPGHLLGLHEIGHEGNFLGGIILRVDAGGAEVGHEALEAGDADKADGRTREVRDFLADLREGGDARAAPRGPEVEDDDPAAEVGEGLEAGLGRPLEMQFRCGLADEGVLGGLHFGLVVQLGEQLVHGLGRLGPGKVPFQGQQQFARLGLVVDHLNEKGRAHERDAGDEVGFLPGMLLEQGVELGDLGRQGFGGGPACLHLGLHLIDDGGEVRDELIFGRGPGRGHLDGRGRWLGEEAAGGQRAEDEAGEQEAEFHEEKRLK